MKTTFAKPFTNMAVSLSGGGYRATAFHLGTLSYLNSVEYEGEKLFKKITTISTISGGTLTGVMVALYLAQGKSFEEAYEKLYQLLHEDKLLEQALHKVQNIDAWDNPTKSKDLINAFSEVYNKKFYDEATYKVLFDSQLSQFEDLTFGSTELSFGQQFRFQKNGDFGNYYLEMPHEVAQHIRLADAAASSSCFPGGFEPMKMPMDYSSSPDGPIVKYWKEMEAKDSNYQSTGVMDGGIIDNQGIEGVLLTEDRRGKSAPYTGTYIVSDVSAKTMTPYQVETLKRSRFADFFTLESITYLVLFITLFITGTLFFYENEPKWITILSTIFLTICASWLLFFWFIKGKILNGLHHFFGILNNPDLFKDFTIIFKTPVYVLAYLAKVRIDSLLVIVNNVFMRRIRSEQISGLFNDDHWNYRFKVNNIYTLEGRDYALDTGDQKEFKLSPQIKASIKLANGMPTTLWFSTAEKEEKMLDNLIACGQFTVCRNLIRYIERIQTTKKGALWASLSDAEKEAILKLDGQLRTDLKLFIEDPLRLVNFKPVVA